MEIPTERRKKRLAISLDDTTHSDGRGRGGARIHQITSLLDHSLRVNDLAYNDHFR